MSHNSEIGKWGGFYLDEVINLMPDDPVPGTKPSHDLAAYTGEFWNPGYGKIKIEQDGDSLKALFRGMEQPMSHYHYDTFKMHTLLVTAPVTFYTDPYDGSISKFDVPFEASVTPIMFTRCE